MNNEELSGRQIVVERFGGVEVLQSMERTVSAPPPGHARVRILAIGVGFTDLMARRGDYLLQRKLPFTPGYELVGEVVDHEELEPGTLVAAALPKMGAYADYVVLPSWLLVPLPDGLDPAIAATVPLDYLTALSILETHAQVTAGDTVLIHGASGGVGQALSQLGKQKGLRMYGTASAPGSEERLARHGVSFIDYRQQDFASVVAGREPEGISAVFDHIGGANIRKGYQLLARGGVFVSYAFAGRPGHMVADTVRGALRVNLLNLVPGRRTAVCMLPKEIKSNHDWYRRSLRRLLEQVHAGELEVTPGATFPLTKAADVHRALERHEINGKVVLTTR
jgi:NADPH:quinone reductase-like Zn-dependent oxidoreductase